MRKLVQYRDHATATATCSRLLRGIYIARGRPQQCVSRYIQWAVVGKDTGEVVRARRPDGLMYSSLLVPAALWGTCGFMVTARRKRILCGCAKKTSFAANSADTNHDHTTTCKKTIPRPPPAYACCISAHSCLAGRKNRQSWGCGTCALVTTFVYHS